MISSMGSKHERIRTLIYIIRTLTAFFFLGGNPQSKVFLGFFFFLKPVENILLLFEGFIEKFAHKHGPKCLIGLSFHCTVHTHA